MLQGKIDEKSLHRLATCLPLPSISFFFRFLAPAALERFAFDWATSTLASCFLAPAFFDLEGSLLPSAFVRRGDVLVP